MTLTTPKAVCALRFMLSMLVLLPVLPMPAQAQDMTPPAVVPISPYVVSDLMIDVSAENAVKAREKAFAEALNQGYAAMIERLVPNASERAQMRTPDTAEIGKLLQDFATRNEKLSTTRYTATYEMRFKPAQVQYLIARLQQQPALPSAAAAGPSSVPAATVSAASVAHQAIPQGYMGAESSSLPVTLVLPFYQPSAQARLWSGDNPLRDALQRANLDGSGLRAPLGDLEDVQAFDETHALTYTPQELAAILARYDAAQAIVAIAVPDAPADGVAEEQTSNLSGMSVMLYRAAPGLANPEYVQALAVSAGGLPNMAAVYARAVDQIRAVVPGIVAKYPAAAAVPAPASVAPDYTAAQQESAPVASTQSIQMLARFQNLQEWQQMRARLAAIGMVQNVRILSLKTQEARLELIYSGDVKALQQALSAKGLRAASGEVDMTADGLRPASMEPAAGVLSGTPPVYTLTLDQWAGSVVVKP